MPRQRRPSTPARSGSQCAPRTCLRLPWAATCAPAWSMRFRMSQSAAACGDDHASLRLRSCSSRARGSRSRSAAQLDVGIEQAVHFAPVRQRIVLEPQHAHWQREHPPGSRSREIRQSRWDVVPPESATCRATRALDFHGNVRDGARQAAFRPSPLNSACASLGAPLSAGCSAAPVCLGRGSDLLRPREGSEFRALRAPQPSTPGECRVRFRFRGQEGLGARR